MIRRLSTFLFVVFSLASCVFRDSRGEIEPKCEGTELPTVEVIARDSNKPVTKDLLVEGAVFHNQGMAIHSVTVLGRTASNDDFNFSQWSVTIPFEVLEELGADEVGEVRLTTEVVDTCGNVQINDETTVVIDPFAGISVTSLDLKVEYAEEFDFVPATILQGATLHITADKSGSGGKVHLQGEGVLFNGNESMDVILESGNSDIASAKVVVTSTKTGEWTIVATSNQAPSPIPVTTTLRCAGSPSLLPKLLSVSPGQSKSSIAVIANGTKPTCNASPASGLTATINAQDITTSSVKLGKDDSTVFIAIDPIATVASTMKITCIDGYGQSDSASVVLTP